MSRYWLSCLSEVYYGCFSHLAYSHIDFLSLFFTVRRLTKCEQEIEKDRLEDPQNMIIGKRVPTCLSDGSYTPRQCSGSSGYCWCVDKSGNKVDGTDRGPTEDEPNCGGEGNFLQ